MTLSDNGETFDLDFPLSDALDNAILMHRDVHFGGSFDIMLEYYERGGLGVQQEFDIKRIQELNMIEKKIKKDLAPEMLTGVDAERVGEAREAYRRLKLLYEGTPSATKQYPRLIADLILAEDDEEAEGAVKVIVAEKTAIVPALVELLRSENLHDPLFPGFGLAPALATRCLGNIGDKRAIIAIFESLGESDFISDDQALEALKHIGEPAKQFLLKVLHGRPLTFDNERAATALINFKDDPEVSKTALEMLKTLDLKRDQILANELILICEGLKSDADRKAFEVFAEAGSTPPSLRLDIRAIVKCWNEEV